MSAHHRYSPAIDLHWKVATKVVPRDKEEVLIRYDGKANLAVFDKGSRCFITRHKMKIDYQATQVLWVRMLPPGEH